MKRPFKRGRAGTLNTEGHRRPGKAENKHEYGMVQEGKKNAGARSRGEVTGSRCERDPGCRPMVVHQGGKADLHRQAGREDRGRKKITA